MNETLKIGLLVIVAIIITNAEFRAAVKYRFTQLLRKWNILS